MITFLKYKIPKAIFVAIPFWMLLKRSLLLIKHNLQWARKTFEFSPQGRADWRASTFSVIGYGLTEKVRVTHFWNLKRDGLGEITVQLWYGADVLLANLSNDDGAAKTMKCFKILDKKGKQKSPQASIADDAQTEIPPYPSIPDSCDERFWTTDTDESHNASACARHGWNKLLYVLHWPLLYNIFVNIKDESLASISNFLPASIRCGS